MQRFFYFLTVLFLLTSCAEQYNIAGNSSVPCLDGQMLYLRVSPEGEMRATETVGITLDSCKVVHGRFNFVGDVDTIRMGMIFSQNQCVMPIVIENGNLSIQVDNVTQQVSGGPLNDKLYTFFKKRNRLDNEMWEIQRRTIHYIREGNTPEEVNRKIGKKAQQIKAKIEELETQFIKENYDNVLGPGFFMLLCSQYPTPIMTEQIEHIINNAPAPFLNNPYVHNYLQQAHLRMTTPSNQQFIQTTNP